MKNRFIPIAFALTAACANAQSIKAADLEQLCSSRVETDRMSCTLAIKVYMDGFIEGVAKGVFDTYRYDPEALALVKDIKAKDAAPRFAKIIDLSTCIQRVSVSEMTKTYLDYVQANPTIRQDHYRRAMTRAIMAKYCGK